MSAAEPQKKQRTKKARESVAVKSDLKSSIEEDKLRDEKKDNEFEDIDEESYEIDSSNELNHSGRSPAPQFRKKSEKKPQT